MPEKKKFTPRLKYYHLFLLSIIFCPILILNSNYANKKRLENKLNEEAKKKFERIVFGRRLAEDEDEEDNFPEDTEKVCKKGSDNQKDYYKTGDGSKIGIKDDAISSEDRPDYINNLIDIIKSSTSDSGEGEIDMKEKLTPYIKHLFPVIFFLAVTVLAIPGWFVCCSCCCANCCCCYCCKKKCCQLPFFIITYACYAIVFFVSIYGLSQSNSIFVGLADTECSLLKFVGDVVYGENKETTPKWGGIENIKTKLDLTSLQFEHIRDGGLQALKNEKERIKPFELTFRTLLETKSGKIKDDIDQTTGSNYKYDDAIFDLAYDFGTFNESHFPKVPNSFVDNWTNEYYDNYKESFLIREGVVIGFDTLINNGIVDTFKGAKQPVDDIKGSIDGVKDQISDIIVSYSDTIDEYGKLGFKIVFSVLTVFVAAIAAIMLLLCFCSGKTCSKCCCFRCGFRIILHILWNFLALLMILTFLIGTIFILVGTIGSDLVLVVSYVVSPENLNQGEGAALLGAAASILTKCLNGDGDISEDLHINRDTEELLENLKSNKTHIDGLIRQYVIIQNNNSRVYKIYDKKLNEREDYSTLDFGFKDSSVHYKYKLNDALNEINRVNNFEELNFHCPANNKLGCNDDLNANNPKKCYDLQVCNDPNLIETRYSQSSNTNNDLKTSASINGPIIDKIVSAQKIANSDTEPGIRDAIDLSDVKYREFLQGEIEGLGAFSQCIGGITGIYDDWVNENDRFLSFLNCKFMGKNIRVVLKFLEKSLGGHFKTVGICLLLSGFSLAIAIIFTILLMSILKENAGK